MAATPWALFGPASLLITNGGIDLDNDSLRVALVTSSWTPNQTADNAWSDMSANEVANGNGYATHGVALAGAALTQSGLITEFDANDVSWTSSTITARYAVIVRDANSDGSLAAGDIPIFWTELEDGADVSTTNGTLLVQMNANGIFRWTAATAV